VEFRPAPLGGTCAVPGVIDYRLARRAVISEFRKGRLSSTDVCDAHPELRRAAEQYSQPTTETCPICEDATLVLVSYVFGPQLPRQGRCVATLAELSKLARRASQQGRQGEFTCYVVEVCPACYWNHLHHVLPLGRVGSPGSPSSPTNP
jgi:hypothetical protein